MSSKTWEELWWVSFFILAVWIVNGILIFFLLTRIDSIVNVQLYNHGLQFSNEWANPYWANIRLMMVFLGLPMAMSIVVVVLGFSRFRRKASGIFSKRKAEPSKVPAEEKEPSTSTGLFLKSFLLSATVETEPEPEAQPEPAKELQLQVIQPIQAEVIQVDQNSVEVEAAETEISEEPKAKEDVGLVISCPSCGKVFNRPLVMLDFSSGTTRLVNICPFCNHILGEALDSKKNNENVQG
jgi:hypothetical protein